MVMVAMCKVREDPGELDLLGPHSIPAGGQLPPEFCLFPARSSHGLQRSHASNFGAGIMGRFRQSRLGENTIIYFLDRVLAHQDELSLQLLRIHYRTTNILRLQSLYSPNFFNDFFFFLKYRSWLYRDIARNHRRGCPSCSLTRSPVSFTSVSFSGFSFLEVAWRPGHAC